jgi:hypothetical protein
MLIRVDLHIRSDGRHLAQGGIVIGRGPARRPCAGARDAERSGTRLETTASIASDRIRLPSSHERPDSGKTGGRAHCTGPKKANDT